MVAAPVLRLVSGITKAPALPTTRTPGGLPRGRLIELAGGPTSASMTTAVQALLACQREGDPVAWIQPAGGDLYPPDLADAGIDLRALLVVHVPLAERRGAARAGVSKAAELILRTGAFGGVVIDMSRGPRPRGDAWLGRLASLSREHDARCVFLGPPSRGHGSLGPLVSIHLSPERERVRPFRYVLRASVLKDKSGHGPTLLGPRLYAGPEGMP